MTTSSISVKDKIAQFELLKKVEESEDSVDGAKRRFGWHPQPKKTPDKVIMFERECWESVNALRVYPYKSVKNNVCITTTTK